MGDQHHAPWWLGRWVRLGVLLLFLGVLLVFAVGRDWSGATGRGWWNCDHGEVPAASTVDRAGLDRLIAQSGIRRLPGSARHEAAGIPQLRWVTRSDRPPTPVTSMGGEAAYELRWTGPDGNRWIAGVFELADPAGADQLVRTKTDTKCRPGSEARGVATPLGGSELTWKNIFGNQQADLWFVRDRRAYRIAEEPPGPSARRVAVACRLPEAGC